MQQQTNTMPNDILNWFDRLVHTLPTWEELDNEDAYSNPPIGITQFITDHESVPFNRSGPAGWTYYPMTEDGSRIVRASHHCPIPNITVTTMFKLTDYVNTEEELAWTIEGPAAVTIDNLNHYGTVEMRRRPNKKQKLTIYRNNAAADVVSHDTPRKSRHLFNLTT